MQLIPRLYKATRHNVLGEDISDIVTRGTVEYNPDRSIKFTLKLTVTDHTRVNPYTDYLAPFLTVRYDDGHEVTSQMGLYAVMPFSQSISQQSRSVEIDGRDLTWLLSVDVFDQGYNVAANTNVVDAVVAILQGAGFTRHAIVRTDRRLGTTRSWKAGTSKLTVINDLLTGAGYYSLGTAKDGTLISGPYQSIVNPTAVVTYDTTDPFARVRVVRDIKLDTTQDRIANKIVVVKDNANEAPIVVTKVNTNPLSPTSTTSLGITIARVVTNADITDVQAAEAIATRYLEEASMQYTKATLYTTPDVEREPNEVYRLNIVNPQGETVADGSWYCRGWTMPFTSKDGPMKHELSNISEPPTDVS